MSNKTKIQEFTIKDIFGDDKFTVEFEVNEGDSDRDIKGKAIIQAIKEKRDMSYANMSDANMRGANMCYANMCYADMSYTNMSYANMRGADMSYANMSYANMRGADMSYANMSYANMRGADMSYANMSYANMRGANMSYANMRGANMRGLVIWDTAGNREEIKSMQIEKYGISYTSEIIQIGCQQHSIEEWKAFDDAAILKMDGRDALRWWKKFKELIFQTIELSPAVKSEYVDSEAADG